jgi:tRNA A-37 threonylcarbamoyl transferase component Bud32
MTNEPSNLRPIQVGRTFFADGPTRHALEPHLDACRSVDQAVWQQVKHNASRTVWKGELAGQRVYLKQFHGRSLSHRLRRLLHRSDAMREMQFSLYLNSKSVRCVETLAGESGPQGEWVLTRDLAPAEPAEQWHARQLARTDLDRRTLQPIILRLAQLIGQMHAAGVIHRDLHLGNVMIDESGHEPELVLMDLHRMSQRVSLSRRAMAANLAQLLHDRLHTTTRTERLRFLKQYLSACGRGGSVRGWQMLIDDLAARHTRRQNRQRDRRIFGTNRYFAPLSLPGLWRAQVVLASKRKPTGSTAAEKVFTAEQWARVLADPTSLMDESTGTLIKYTPSGKVVRRTLRLGETDIDLFVKQPRTRRIWKRLANIFRTSRPKRAFHLGHQLLTRRIATALPLAVLERRIGPFLLDSILITETVHAPHLYEFMDAWLSVPPKTQTPLSVPQQRQLAQEVLWQLGRMLQQLHDNRFAHRDLKATNIRVYWQLGQKPAIILVDLDGVVRVHAMTARRMFQGLMRLNVSLLQCPVVNHAGRLRMLLGYLRRPGSGRIHFKPYWRFLETWSARKLSQQLRSRQQRQKAQRRPA